MPKNNQQILGVSKGQMQGGSWGFFLFVQAKCHKLPIPGLYAAIKVVTIQVSQGYYSWVKMKIGAKTSFSKMK